MTKFEVSRRALLQSVAPLTAAALGGGLGFPTDASAQIDKISPQAGGDLTLCIAPEPNSLCTINSTAGADVRISAKVHEGLLGYDFEVTPEPQLAKEWSISSDGLRYTFKLRDGVKWHDGKPFTSADVASSINLLKKFHPRGQVTFANVSAVETPDPLTAIVVLSKPAPFLIYAFAASESPMVAKHLYDGPDVRTNPHNQAPVGTGPFKFKVWERGSHAIFERNPDYWAKPKPYPDRLIVRFIADAAARAAAFETKEIDIAGETPVAMSDVSRLAALPHIKTTTEGYSYSPQQMQMEFNLDRPYVKDLRVRQAIAHTIDRDVMVKVVFLGQAIAAPSPISPLLKRFYTPDVETYPFNIATAEKLLDEAGYPKKADGTRFSLFLDYNPAGPDRTAVANYMKQAMQRVGIVATIRNQDPGAFAKRVYTDRDFDLQINVLNNLFDPTVGVQRLYHSKNFLPGVPFTNGSHYSNPEVDRLLEEAAVEPNEPKRIALFKQFQQIASREIPLLNLVTKLPVTIYNTRVHNHTVSAEGLRDTMADVFIKV